MRKPLFYFVMVVTLLAGCGGRLMRNKLKTPILVAVFFVLVLVSCGPQENAEQLKAVNQSLERYNKSTIDDNKLLIASLLDKQRDPQTAAVVEPWFQRANKIHQNVDTLRKVMEVIKSELIIQSDSLKREYVTVVKQLSIENGVGSNLFKRLTTFKDSIPLFINSNRTSDVPNDIPLLPGYVDSLSARGRLQYEMNWLEKSFGRSSSLMAMIMLNKIENDVLETEKKLLEYCNSRFCIMKVIYSQYQALAVLSSSYVKKGQPIEITAGVGGFTHTVKPRVTIDGKVIQLNENGGTAVHRFTADGRPGKHSVMVQIDFTGFNGSQDRVTRKLEYIIADEK